MTLSLDEVQLRARAIAYARQHKRPRRSHRLLDYAQQTWPGYEIHPHIETVAAELEAIERGENKRLMIFMPPRFGKSELVSIRFPAWYLCEHPDRMVIATTYGDTLSREFGETTRDTIGSELSRQFYPDVALKPDAKAAQLWRTNRGGRYLSAVIGGGITGHGAHVFLVDDPIKNREEAESATYRERIWRWFRGVARTRLEPGGAIVIMHTRWHPDDLAGRLLAEQAGQWRVIKIPAIDERGETPWPGRYSVEELREIRSDVGEREWSSQYQQEPRPVEGTIFKWWPRYKAMPEPSQIEQLIMPLDTAYTDTTGSDYTAWAIWARCRGRLYLLDAQRVRLETPEAAAELKRYHSKLTEQFRAQGYQGNIKILVRRSVAIDRIMAQHLRAMGVNAVPVDMPSIGGREVKQSLARIVVDHFEGEQALIPDGYVPWLQPWLDEHEAFGPGDHEDHWVETIIIALWYTFRSVPITGRREPISYANV